MNGLFKNSTFFFSFLTNSFRKKRFSCLRIKIEVVETKLELVKNKYVVIVGSFEDFGSLSKAAEKSIRTVFVLPVLKINARIN